MRSTRNAVLGIALTALCAGVVACGDDDDSDPGADSSAPALSGAPIEVGLINTESASAGSYPEIREATQAAVRYVNEELGGVNGRPLAVENCVTNSSPESSLACSNKFVQAGKVAVLGGLDYGTAASVPPLTKAGIPYVGGIAIDTAELTAPNAFQFIGSSPSALASLSTYIAQDAKASKVTTYYIDIPAGKLAAEGFGKTVLNNLGVTDVAEVPESPTAADMTASLTKANEGDPGAIIALFAGQQCSRVMQAAASLGVAGDKLYMTFVCSAPEQVEAGGAGAEGAHFNTPFLPVDADDPDVAAYVAAMEKYAGDTEPGQVNAQVGFNSVVNLANILKEIQGEITPQAIIDALKAAKDEPNFMGHPYTCDGNQVPNLPAICNANERIVQYQDGKFEDVKGDWIDGATNLVPR